MTFDPSMGGSPRVLRLSSVFEPADEVVARPEFDPIGGMQNHTAALTRALDALGVEQTVITSRLGGPTGTTPLGAAARVVRVGLPVRRMRQAWAAAALRPALANGPVDVVHAHQGEDLAVLPLGALLARRFGCPLVVTLHCSLRHSVPKLGNRLTTLNVVGGALEHRLIDRADTVIALTRTTASRLTGAHRTVVLPSGVDTTLFAEAVPSPLLTGIPGPRLLYLGRLAQQKDVPTLVRAFALVRSPASLVIVGDGPDAAAVDSAIEALPDPVRARVHRIGFRPHHEVPDLLAAADVLVLPSVYEEMGSILVEALQAGVPAVASQVGGIPDVVIDGRTGLLFPPGDARALAAALDSLLAEPATLVRMRAESRHRAGDYSWAGLARRVLGVYAEAIGTRATARSSSPASEAATSSIP